MNFRKGSLSMLAVTILTLSMHCTAFAANKTTLQVNNVVKTMTINTKKTLSIKSNGTVTCKTLNKNVIAVSKKKLTAKGTGIAEITVTSKKNGWKRTTKKFTVLRSLGA